MRIRPFAAPVACIAFTWRLRDHLETAGDQL